MILQILNSFDLQVVENILLAPTNARYFLDLDFPFQRFDYLPVFEQNEMAVGLVERGTHLGQHWVEGHTEGQSQSRLFMDCLLYFVNKFLYPLDHLFVIIRIGDFC